MYDFQGSEYVIFFSFIFEQERRIRNYFSRLMSSAFYDQKHSEHDIFIFRNLLEIHTKTLLFSTNLRDPSGQGSYVSIHWHGGDL